MEEEPASQRGRVGDSHNALEDCCSKERGKKRMPATLGPSSAASANGGSKAKEATNSERC
ncbi:hypothetical protein LSCM1_00278 [Leishmania martiniquensis]|uniref:Uncharacterized protein n=1 Tax=Leishmania martiniquensis TaxID=1580590 RepID=A0A836GTZ3_9TRYP|nr:hypothetical protein LSCM1_00278 [Leishmania martiniquensis]